MEIIIPQGPDMKKIESYLFDRLGTFLRDFYPVSGGLEVGKDIWITQLLPVDVISLEEAAEGRLMSRDSAIKIWRALILSDDDGTPLVTVDFDNDACFLEVTQGGLVLGLFEALNIVENIPGSGQFVACIIEIPSLVVRALRLSPTNGGSEAEKRDAIFIPIEPLFKGELRRKPWFIESEFVAEVLSAAEKRLKFKTLIREVGVLRWVLGNIHRFMRR